MPGPVYSQPTTAVSRTVSAATSSAPPAGGTGATGGAYDTSGNRDLMIASLTAVRADLDALRQTVNALVYDLKCQQIIG